MHLYKFFFYFNVFKYIYSNKSFYGAQFSYSFHCSNSVQKFCTAKMAANLLTILETEQSK